MREGDGEARTPGIPARFEWGDAFPRGEILLACGLALALRLTYLVGVAQGPLFLHPVIENPGGHSFGWFFAAISALTGHDPLVLRVAQALLGTGSVFLLSATAHEIWGRRAAVATAEVAALYGPLVYFASDLSPATLSFFLVTASLYGCARATRSRFRPGIMVGGLALGLATVVAIATGAVHGGAAGPHRLLHLFSNVALAWNWREVPCGAIDQGFFARFNSAIFRLPWLPSFALVGPIAFVAAWSERRRAPLLVGYLLLATLAIAATQVCDRTRLVLLAAALPLAGRGIDRLFAAVSQAAAKARRWPGAALAQAAREHAATAILLGCAGAFVLAPSPTYPRPEAGTGWVAVARAYQDAGNPRAAQSAFISAEKTGLRSADFYADWGRLEFEKRLGILAEQHLLTAIGIDPGNADAHETLGEVYYDQERYGQAGQEYGVAAGLLPKRAAELYTRAGEAYEEGRDPVHAGEMFRVALRVEPGYPAAATGIDRIMNPVPPTKPAKMFPPLSPSSGR
ncbi:MAG TPA: tetratricopeptide repeat protein [Candidatus Binatia bacterium]|nr:tetratricopeptide repeat protein [Candidatus Binatia bacterium]